MKGQVQPMDGGRLMLTERPSCFNHVYTTIIPCCHSGGGRVCSHFYLHQCLHQYYSLKKTDLTDQQGAHGTISRTLLLLELRPSEPNVGAQVARRGGYPSQSESFIDRPGELA